MGPVDKRRRVIHDLVLHFFWNQPPRKHTANLLLLLRIHGLQFRMRRQEARNLWRRLARLRLKTEARLSHLLERLGLNGDRRAASELQGSADIVPRRGQATQPRAPEALAGLALRFARMFFCWILLSLGETGFWNTAPCWTAARVSCSLTARRLSHAARVSRHSARRLVVRRFFLHDRSRFAKRWVSVVTLVASSDFLRMLTILAPLTRGIRIRCKWLGFLGVQRCIWNSIVFQGKATFYRSKYF